MKFLPLSRTLLACSALALTLLCSPAWSADKQARQAQPTRNKIVIQVSDEDTRKWHSVISNLRNIQTELGANNVKIVVVAYGNGLGMLTLDSPVGGEVADAVKNGVGFVACENTMKGQHLTKDDMLPDLGYAAAAIVEIMKLQQQGYAYIKP